MHRRGGAPDLSAIWARADGRPDGVGPCGTGHAPASGGGGHGWAPTIRRAGPGGPARGGKAVRTKPGFLLVAVIAAASLLASCTSDDGNDDGGSAEGGERGAAAE